MKLRLFWPPWRTSRWRPYALGYVAGTGAFSQSLPRALRVFLVVWSLVIMLIDVKPSDP